MLCHADAPQKYNCLFSKSIRMHIQQDNGVPVTHLALTSIGDFSTSKCKCAKFIFPRNTLGPQSKSWSNSMRN
jgi:hypothetical protein